VSFPTSCQRLRMGGVVSGSSITGGTVIESGGIALASWDGILGYPGRVGEDAPILGRDGAHRNTKTYRERLVNVAFLARDRDATGTIVLPDGRRQHLQVNLDGIASLIDGAGATVILERDLADGAGGTVTRWIELEAVEASTPVRRSALFGPSHSAYEVVQQFRAAYPMWQSETLHTDTLTQAGSPNVIANAGNGRISNAVLVFAADSLVTHGTDAATLEITGSAGAVTVDIGAASITNGGGSADNLLEPPAQACWMRLYPGANALTVTGANVDLSWRDHWL